VRWGGAEGPAPTAFLLGPTLKHDRRPTREGLAAASGSTPANVVRPHPATAMLIFVDRKEREHHPAARGRTSRPRGRSRGHAPGPTKRWPRVAVVAGARRDPGGGSSWPGGGCRCSAPVADQALARAPLRLLPGSASPNFKGAPAGCSSVGEACQPTGTPEGPERPRIFPRGRGSPPPTRGGLTSRARKRSAAAEQPGRGPRRPYVAACV